MAKKTVGYTTDVTVDVDVDVDEVLEFIEDDDLIKELNARGYEISEPDSLLSREDVHVLIQELNDVIRGTSAWWVREKLYAMLR